LRPVVGPNDHVVELPDGRLLGYAAYGDPDGAPVLNCHGGLTCRLDVEPAHTAARAAGLRILSPDRPGIALSSRLRGRTIGMWTDDVTTFADVLGIERFAVMGWSFGGPYAAACAALIPERVRGTAIVAGSVPPDWPCVSRGFGNVTDAAILRLCQVAPGLASAMLRGAGELAALAPRWWMRGAARAMAPRDLDAIERDGVEAFIVSIAEGLRCPGGVVDDYVACTRPWGFAYEDVAGPVHLWQGDEDRLVPSSWSEEAAKRIPEATLSMLPGFGHMLARDHWEAIFADLVP
jgi:pimeloyl-ACP methyl ester carboxylesterase